MESKKKRKRSAKKTDDEEVSTKIAKTDGDDLDMKLGKIFNQPDWRRCLYKYFSIPGLADEDGETNDDRKKAEKMEEEAETPIPVDNKPFVAKKFRDGLRRSSYITGK